MGLLIDELYSQLNPLGKTISVVGSYYSEPDFTLDESEKVEYIDVLTYDLWGFDSQDPEGYPHSSYNDAVQVMQQWLDWGFSSSKLIMGIPFYGRSTTQKAYHYSRIVNTLNPTDDQNTGTISGETVWWNGIDTTKEKVEWAIQKAGGVMAFAIGYDKLNDPKSLLKIAIYDQIHPKTVIPTPAPIPGLSPSPTPATTPGPGPASSPTPTPGPGPAPSPAPTPGLSPTPSTRMSQLNPGPVISITLISLYTILVAAGAFISYRGFKKRSIRRVNKSIIVMWGILIFILIIGTILIKLGILKLF